MNDISIRSQHAVGNITSGVDVTRPKSSLDEAPVSAVQAAESVHAVHEKVDQPDHENFGEPLPETGQDLAAAAEDPTQLEQAVADIKDYFQTVQRDLSFSMDKDSGRTLIRVTDTHTGEVVRQIPTETVLKLAEALKANQDTDSLKGLLFSGSA
jgi:flagellar protein FlaG